MADQATGRKNTLLFDALKLMRYRHGKAIVTMDELCHAIRCLTLAEWEFMAKENLAGLGFITERDVFLYTEQISWLVYFEDPDPTVPDYTNTDIIPDAIDYGDILLARSFIGELE